MSTRQLLSVIFISIVLTLLFFSVGSSIAEEKMVMVGTVKSIESKMVMDVENEKDKALVSFRIGRKTVYTPRRYPIPGERVKVEYLPHRGNFVAYTVTILGVSGAKESPK
ncbi:MAG: hypothetical protein FJ130_10245 [Deltaproteobacteria bacterium]|nr:hypothetical protein [Deltaproteobacteria bacterium]